MIRNFQVRPYGDRWVRTDTIRPDSAFHHQNMPNLIADAVDPHVLTVIRPIGSSTIVSTHRREVSTVKLHPQDIHTKKRWVRKRQDTCISYCAGARAWGATARRSLGGESDGGEGSSHRVQLPFRPC